MEKEQKKEQAKVVVGYCITLTILVAIALHPLSLIHLGGNAVGTSFANWEMQNSNLVNETVNYCGIFPKSVDQIKCIVNRVGKAYNYSSHNTTFPIVLLSDEITEGYICRDISVTYGAIFRKLGYFHEYIFTTKHVYNRVWKDVECYINMDEYFCW